MGLLAPLFALGMALIGIPYLVHRIRRPEREPVRFSSLMFVPEVKREVIERRRVQHISLMILRMAMLAVLALAFARPFREVISTAAASLGGATDHVIALDVSMSMGYDGVWARAKMQANAALDAVAPGDRVGFVQFANRALGTVPISGDVALVRRAIDEADATWAHTDYSAALRATAQLFEADTAQVRRVGACDQRFSGDGHGRRRMAVAWRDRAPSRGCGGRPGVQCDHRRARGVAREKRRAASARPGAKQRRTKRACGATLGRPGTRGNANRGSAAGQCDSGGICHSRTKGDEWVCRACQRRWVDPRRPPIFRLGGPTATFNRSVAGRRGDALYAQRRVARGIGSAVAIGLGEPRRGFGRHRRRDRRAVCRGTRGLRATGRRAVFALGPVRGYRFGKCRARACRYSDRGDCGRPGTRNSRGSTWITPFSSCFAVRGSMIFHPCATTMPTSS